MSIELGFAEIDLGNPGERRLSLIDVPGHERFVRTMIAGASGVDMFLLVVAADDGPMPQTLEHLAVLRALAVEHGVVALTKVDLVDEEKRQIAAEATADLVPGAPLVEVSPHTGEGLGELRSALAAAADAVTCLTSRALCGLWSGQLERSQRVAVLPEEHEGRIRSIEVHDRPCNTAEPHQRVALNLGGIDRDEVARGDVITVEGGGVVREPYPPRHGPGWERRPTEEEPMPASPSSPLEPSDFAHKVLAELEKDETRPRGGPASTSHLD